MGGVSPTLATSAAPARNASRIAGPPVKLANCAVKGSFSSSPEARSATCWASAWSAMTRVVPAGTSVGSGASAASPPPPGVAVPQAATTSAASKAAVVASVRREREVLTGILSPVGGVGPVSRRRRRGRP
jgi:hypothetical protein